MDHRLREVSSPKLLERYESYRLSQGRALMRLLPRGGLRMVLDRAEGVDPSDLDRLAHVCADLLPLPPYATWLRDFHANRSQYDADGAAVAAADLPDGAGVTVDIRLFRAGAEEWTAALELFQGHPGWRGRIRFHSPDSDRVTSTTEIFREELSTQVRERFASTDENTLRAFLRSTLP